MKVTIKDVAERANVSIATVSRVFNKSGSVTDETRHRVLTIARDLRYTPNASARSLSTSKTDTVGLLLPDLYGEFFSEVIRGADQTVQQHHHHLLVSSSHNNRSEIEAALRVMRGRVDGLVIMSPHIDAATLNANLPKSLPVVLLNCYVRDSSFDSLNIDNFGGANQMVKHLIQHHHARIAIIKGTEQNYDAEERLSGYRTAVREANLETSPDLEFSGDFTEEAGFEAAKKILHLQNRPTAIFASNDSMAIGAISALRESGVHVPEEMAVAGFDDIPISRFMKPGLSSVHVPISNLGVLAMEHLFAAVTEKDNYIKKQDIITTELVVRESCGIHETNNNDD